MSGLEHAPVPEQIGGGAGIPLGRSGLESDARPGRRRLLFLCQALPFPPDAGAHIRSFNVVRLLTRAFDVTALCFYRRRSRPDRGAVAMGIAGLSELARVEAFRIPQEHSSVRLLWDHLRSVALRRPYVTYIYESRAYRARLTRLLAEQCFDIIHVDSLDLAAYVPTLGDIPVVCTHHNVESDLLRRRARTQSSWLLRQYMKLQASLIEKDERAWCARVALNVAVSQGDAARIREISPGAAVAVHPNGVDTGVFRPAEGDGAGLVFVGGYDWYPNREAMRYFAEQVLPLLHACAPGLSMTWVGRAPPGAREAYARLGIQMTGYVEDIRPYVHAAACYVVPLRAGGGTRVKILDAWAMGKAVVSTSIGSEGLDAHDGQNILIRDTPEGFAAAVRQVLGDVGFRRRLGREARLTAERVYDWDVIGGPLLQDYAGVLANRRLTPKDRPPSLVDPRGA